MAIEFVSVSCPQCGAELSIESGREFAFCSYCGAKVVMNNTNEYVYRNIDEAKIRQTENDKLLRLKELELEEKENARNRKNLFIAYGVALVFVLIGALICIWQPIGGMWGIIIGAYIALMTYLKSENQKKTKKKRYVSSNEGEITPAMLDLIDKNYQSAVLLFTGAGFTNVTAVPLNDVGVLGQRKIGKVETITINGNEEFDLDEVYPKDSNILITYHSR